jgi:hypothetical protein
MMVGAIALVAASPNFRVLLVAFGGIILLNALLHVTLSVLTRSYSPGAISGLLCWAPLGVYTLRREWRELPHATFASGIAIALGLHAVVTFFALSS